MEKGPFDPKYELFREWSTETLVVEDATATWNTEMHRAAVEVMRSKGAEIVCTSALLAEGA